MITKNNLKQVFEMIDQEQAEQINLKGDYIAMELCTFNVGSVVRLESLDYDEDTEESVSDSGNLFVDKDDFLRLYRESGANNPEIEKFI